MNLGFIRQYLGLPGRIYVLFLARIIAAMGSFIYSFLTLFMSSRLGYSEGKIAYYLLLLAIISLPGALLGGKLADMFSRKYTYVALMGTAEILFLISGFVIDSPYVIGLIFAGFFFVNAASPVTAAMIMDYTRPENRQESLSLVYLGFNMGYAIGPMIAGFLFAHYIRWIFWGNAIINMISVLLVLFLIKDEAIDEGGVPTERKEETLQKETKNEISRGSLLRQLAHDPVLVLVAFFMISATFSYSQVGYMMPLDMERVFGIELGSRAYGVIWSLNGFGVF
ncbi:MAG: MFS transporter, partial [Firmicutes bacterium]|nr:MFS transporter [Bacillota bacterium]